MASRSVTRGRTWSTTHSPMYSSAVARNARTDRVVWKPTTSAPSRPSSRPVRMSSVSTRQASGPGHGMCVKCDSGACMPAARSIRGTRYSW